MSTHLLKKPEANTVPMIPAASEHRRAKLPKQLFLLLVLFSFVPLVACGVFAYQKSRDAILESELKTASFYARSFLFGFDAFVRSIDDKDPHEFFTSNLDRFQNPDRSLLEGSAQVELGIRTGQRIIFFTGSGVDEYFTESTTLPFEKDSTAPIQKVLSSELGGSALVVDHLGKEVLAAWAFAEKTKLGVVYKKDKADVLHPIYLIRNFAIGMGLLSFIAIVLIARFIAQSVSKPVHMLTQNCHEYAEGDLRNEVSIYPSSDVGELAVAYKSMTDSLKALVVHIKVIVDDMSQTSLLLRSSAEQQSSSADETGSASVEVNTTAKEISTTAVQLSETMQSVTEVTQETAQKAESGLDVLQRLESSMHDLSAGNQLVREQLGLIEGKAHAINNITLTMTKVADQTNLLSLNAAIEAKKAGEFGKGFAVVAEEIKHLADQVAQSTLNIEKSIREMSTAVNVGVNRMNNFSSRVDDSVQEITAISNRLGEVIQQVQGLPPRFDQILEGMQSQAKGASNINVSMSQLSESAQKTANAVRETNRTLERLHKHAESLQHEVRHYKT